MTSMCLLPGRWRYASVTWCQNSQENSRGNIIRLVFPVCDDKYGSDKMLHCVNERSKESNNNNIIWSGVCKGTEDTRGTYCG